MVSHSRTEWERPLRADSTRSGGGLVATAGKVPQLSSAQRAWSFDEGGTWDRTAGSTRSFWCCTCWPSSSDSAGWWSTASTGRWPPARRGREGAAIGEAVDKGYKFAEWPIYAVPVLGILLVLLSDDVFKFSQVWISLSFLLYIVAIGLLHGVHLPTVRRINALLKELAGTGHGGRPDAGEGGPPPQVAELDQLGAKAGVVGGILNLLTVVILFLMVFKPGFP